MAASVGMVVPLAAQTYPKPAKPAPAQEEPAKIEGLTIARKNGGFIGLNVVGSTYVMKFYDADKKPVDADVSRALARWQPSNIKADLRAVLNPAGDGKSLISPGLVRPPLNFTVYITLFDAQENVIENVVANLRELNAAKE
jgi:hypothetical protein